MQKTYQIAIAGTTKNTTQLAQVLLNHPQFGIPWVLTPQPRKIGRKQVSTKNPLHQFATQNNIKSILLDKKIDLETKREITQLEKPDFLLVVDFGFLVPNWLLEIPKIAPVNVHPSDLPRWRGSSPGQFVLLYGEKESFVTIMVMNQGLDEGPILKQLPFIVENDWTQTEYYQHSFDLVTKELTQVLLDLANKKITPHPQLKASPTVIARRLSKQDSVVDWKIISTLMEGKETSEKLSADPKSVLNALAATPQNFYNACRALSPWPKLWTIINTNKGQKRMIIHDCFVKEIAENGEQLKSPKLILGNVQIEGKSKTSWEQSKNALT